MIASCNAVLCVSNERIAKVFPCYTSDLSSGRCGNKVVLIQAPLCR